ncbi:benzaldehyde dehydrogenase, partial [Streptomyces griseosporeus]
MTLLDDEVWAGRYHSDGWRDAAEIRPVVEPATGDGLGAVGLAAPGATAPVVRAQMIRGQYS